MWNIMYLKWLQSFEVPHSSSGPHFFVPCWKRWAKVSFTGITVCLCEICLFLKCYISDIYIYISIYIYNFFFLSGKTPDKLWQQCSFPWMLAYAVLFLWLLSLEKLYSLLCDDVTFTGMRKKCRCSHSQVDCVLHLLAVNVKVKRSLVRLRWVLNAVAYRAGDILLLISCVVPLFPAI